MPKKKNQATVIKQSVERVSAIEHALFQARFDAVEDILSGASKYDVLYILSYVVGTVLAGYCPEHKAEIMADFNEMLDGAVDMIESDDEPAQTASDTGASVH